MATPEPRPGPTQHRVIGAQQRVDPLEHRPQSLVVHRLAAQPVTVVAAAQRPPQGLERFQRIEPSQIQPDPHDRLRAGREPLLRSRALPADPHELLTPVQVAAPHAEQLAGTGAGADPQCQDRPVPVRPQPREQLVPPLVRHRPRRAPRNPRVIADLPLRPERRQGVVMLVRPPAPPVQCDRVDQRPAAQLDPELIKAPQHRVAVPHRPRLVLITEIALAGHRVDGAGRGGRHRPRRGARLRCLPQPQDEVPDLSGGRLVPAHADDRQPPPPSQQVIGIAANTAGPVAAGHEVPQEPLDRLYCLAVRINHQPRHDTLSLNDTAPLRQPDRGDVPLDESTRQRHASSLERVA